MRQALKTRSKELKKDGKGNKQKAAKAFTDEEINNLYDKQLLSNAFNYYQISNAEVWKAITFLCGHSLLHDVVSLLCDVVSPLHGAVSPLRGVVSPLRGVVLSLCDVVSPLCDVVSPLCDVVLSLCGVVSPLRDVVLSLCDVVSPLCDVVLSLSHFLVYPSCKNAIYASR